MPTITKVCIAICAVGAALNLFTGLRTGDPWRYAAAAALTGLAIAQWNLGARQVRND